MRRIDDIVEIVQPYYRHADIHLLDTAYVFAAKVHKGQIRLSGAPYLSHPLEVASILAEMRMDAPSVITGLLHDVVEDTDTTIQQIEDLFGPEIAMLVDGVTKFSKIQFRSREEYQAENLRKMMLAMTKDIRVIIIKLADRLHNMRTLGYAPEANQIRIAQETLDIYAPLANRLGLGRIKIELEDLCLKYLQPQVYNNLEQQLQEKRQYQHDTLEKCKQIIEEKLTQMDIKAQITGRPKHLYSIYKKMSRLGIIFVDEILDVVGLRIVTETLADCYSILGIVHSTWRPVPGSFDDYIALPKPNGYQSLHTAVIGPQSKPIEFQIRTWDMHRMAEEGIAAHWRYKEGKKPDEDYDKKVTELRQRLTKQLEESLYESKNSREFIENLKIDLFPDEVYVFTPRGEVKELPRGSTPIDFAYAIHSEVGNQCIGAKVNGRIVPLRYELQTGDTVEILTQKNHFPSADWLSFVKTTRAKNRIKQWLRIKQKEESIVIGQELLLKELQKAGYKISRSEKIERLKDVALELGFHTEEDLIASVGFGKTTAHQIVQKLFPEEEARRRQEEDKAFIKAEKPAKTPSSDKLRTELTKEDRAIKVKGIGDILTRFAQCCNPLPGDQIIGYITRGRGITIHAIDCPNAQAIQFDLERKIDVEWDLETEATYPAQLYVTSRDKPGLAAEITTAIAKTGTNILSVKSETIEDAKRADFQFILSIKNRQHLDKVIRSIYQVKEVVNVSKNRIDGLVVE
jgi:GTP pyrophosphokinase